MRLFVTGGAGFIGANYVHWLLANSDDHITVFEDPPSRRHIDPRIPKNHACQVSSQTNVEIRSSFEQFACDLIREHSRL